MFQYKLKNNRPAVAYIYNPQNQSKEELIVSYVVRLKIFKKLFEEIKTSKMEHPEQHFLIEGKHGMGKTTLLLRLSYEIENDKNLSEWLIPLVFNEEEYSIRALFKLWERIAELLEEKSSLFDGLKSEMESLSKQNNADDEYEKACFDLLTSQLQKHEKKIILFIDNFGDMFQKFKDKEIHRLRKILQTSSDLRIFAASSVVLEAFYDYNHPFYEFFKIERLDSLDAHSTRELLIKLGKFYKYGEVQEIVLNQKGRVEALRRLTGGVIRTIVLLFEIFADNEDGNAFQDLETVLDRVTPLYKHKMDDLPAPQQEIVETIALSWDAISVKEIAERTRMESKVVSANLNQLVKSDVIHKIRTNTKNNLYQISDRFFNIWYLMRHGRNGDKSKVIWLVHFLEEWCNNLELTERPKMQVSNLKNDHKAIASKTLTPETLIFNPQSLLETQQQLLKNQRDSLVFHYNGFDKKLLNSDLKDYKKAIGLFQNAEFEEALPLFLNLKEADHLRIGYCYEEGVQDIEKAAFHYSKATENQETVAHFLLGSLAQLKLNNFDDAKDHYLKAAETGSKDAAFALGTLNIAGKHYLEAFEQLKIESNKGNGDASLLLASAYIAFSGQPEKAEETFLEIFSNHGFFTPEALSFKHRLKLIRGGLMFLIAAGQYDFLVEFFNDEKLENLHLKERFKPVYYALMFFMQEQFPREYLRMGDELKETVDEIVALIHKMEQLYF